MKQIKRLKREKVSLFLAAAVLSLGILSGCGGESKEAKEARMTGIEQLNAGNYQDAIDSFGKALDESDGIVNSFELDVLKYRGEAEYKLADYKAAAQTYGILAEVDGGKAEYLYYKAASEAADGQAEDAEKDFAAAEEKAKNSKKSSAAMIKFASGPAASTHSSCVRGNCSAPESPMPPALKWRPGNLCAHSIYASTCPLS